ncbi:hypothetical protein CGMCC3_g11368 [Colletotrichum fructicola]|nr:uncharacterized protein CGMCC3_g11368 [Colletotrichum fructicola]KAE9572512.1 hypothetical protein CGMCC3_g11368 [Colletotrichum fructicola]
MPRSNSFVSNAGEDHLSLPSRHNTLKKKNSLRRNGSLKRSGSRRSMKAGSVRSLALQSTSDPDEAHSAFHCPVPTSGNPTEALSNRFQSWRKILKDLIAYYREIQTHYEHKSKSLLKLANVANNISTPPGFLESGGIDDALQILRTYHKGAILESNKAKEIEEDVILALTGLRSDLHQKIKEIKNLSGDFKNSVEKEMDGTRRAVKTLQDTIGQSDLDPSLTTGKQDPYLLRLAVDRQVERQIDEENYLHQAYLNLENSGRELESIVVGEIQKAYNAYAGILKRESDAAYSAIDELRIGPITMPKDHEWTYFVQKDDQFVDPNIPIRSAEHIHYPGRDHVACQEIRAGLLERKSKYLKSYTAGWYVLSPTHLHEFKSADKGQAPVMSLYLPEQKLGSHSSEGGSSNKFILKGRQTGSMHRGHTWVFRAESHDTMMACSRSQHEFEAGLAPSRSSVSSGFDNWDRDAAAQPSALPGGMLGTVHLNGYGGTARTPMEQTPSNAALVSQQAKEDGVNPYTNEPLRRSQSLHKDSQAAYLYATGMQRAHTQQAAPTRPEEDVQRTSSIDHDRGLETPGGNSQYGQWMNGNTKSSQVTSSTDNQRQDASDYSVSAKPGNDDINVAAVAAGTSASRGLNNIHTQQSGTSSGTPNPRNQDLFRQTQSAPRPTAGTIRNDSVPTISNLHIPGEYPKGGSTAVDARR